MVIASAGWVVAAAAVVGGVGIRTGMPGVHPSVGVVLDFALTSAPLVAAVLVGAAVASRLTWLAATGVVPGRWTDIAIGVGAGLTVRALVELVVPAGGSLSDPAGGGSLAFWIAAAGAVVVSPLVEELFFRGLLQRALGDALAGAGRLVAGVAAILVSTAAFTALHTVALPQGVPVSLLVGTASVSLACGILTRATGRLGSAIVAHATFNLIGVWLLLG